jgi:TP901 family phage tail tape measure protein
MVDDVNANIGVNIDTSSALASLKVLQRQISLFHTQMAAGGAVANSEAAKLQSNLLNAVSATGKFQASMTRVNSTTEAFTTALEKNKLTMGQYFRYAGGASRNFGRAFKSEFDTITKVAVERVKDLQTQYISMGRDANGALKAIKIRPLTLDMQDLTTKTMVAAQKQQLFNQLLTQGSTNLLNFGKNTQWAGRQLMVGFTIPLTMFATAAAKSFMDIEKQIIKIRRVYGDFSTTVEETDQMVKSIKSLAGEYTKYGIAVKDTIGLASEAAAAGKTGQELLAQVAEATRLAVLGNVEQSAALETTMSITNAFGTATQDLAGKIDFLNAVENQSVTSIEDLTEAIPKAGPVVQQLGGDVEDLAFFLTAMKEGGINASEGANALKSGLAALINPTGKAKEMLQGFGINIENIVNSNKGDIKGLVIDFAEALDTLDPLDRAKSIEQLFGKFQFSRLSTLFQNVIGEGTQASRVLELTKSTTQELALLSQRELKKVEETTTYKFEKAFADFQAALAPVGEQFLKVVTPILEFGTRLLDQFNNMEDGAKNFSVILTTVVAGVGPVLLMTVGLVANGVANLIKMFQMLGGIFRKTGTDTGLLGVQTDYMTQQQIEAAAVAASLNQSHSRLTQTFSVEAAALNSLTAAYQRAVTAQRGFGGAGSVPGSATKPKKYAKGVVAVPGPKGKGDVVPAMLSPGEAVIPSEMAKKYAPLINGMIADNIPGYIRGLPGRTQETHAAGAMSKTPEVLAQVDRIFPGFSKIDAALLDVVEILSDLTTTKTSTLNQAAKGKGMSGENFSAEWAKNPDGFVAAAARAADLAGEQLSDEDVLALVGIDDQVGKRVRDRIDKIPDIAKLPKGWLDDLIAEETAAVIDNGINSPEAAVRKNSERLQSRKNTVGTLRTVRAGEQIDPRTGKPFGKADKYFDYQRQQNKLEGRPGKVGLYAPGSDFQFSRTLYSGTEEEKRAQQAAAKIERERKLPTSFPQRVNSATIGSFPGSYEAPTPGAIEQTRRLAAQQAETQAESYNDQLAKTAQTNSPSRVTRKIGQDTAQGYIDGVQSGVDKAEKTGRTKGRRVTKTTGGPIVVEQTGTQAVPTATRKGPRRATRPQGSPGPVIYSPEVMYGPQDDPERKPKKPPLRDRIARGAKAIGPMGGMMAAGAIGGGLSMIPGLQGLGAAISIVGPLMMMLPAKIAIALGAFAALGYGIYTLVDNLNKANTAGVGIARAMSATQDKIEAVSEATGTVSATQSRRLQTEALVSGNKIEPGGENFGQTFLGTDAGKGLLADVATQKSAGVKDMAKNLAVQLSTYVAQGVMTSDQAQSIAIQLGTELKDYKLSTDIRANLTSIIGPNGENLEKDPLQVTATITAINNSNAQKAMQAANTGQQNPATSTGVQVGTGLAVAGGLGAIGAAAAGGAAALGQAALAFGGAQTAFAGTMAAAGALSATGIGLIAAGVVAIAGITMAVIDWNTVQAKNTKLVAQAVAAYASAYEQNAGMVDVINQQYDKKLAQKEADLQLATSESQRLGILKEISTLEGDRATALDIQAQSQQELLDSMIAQKGTMDEGMYQNALRETTAQRYEDNPMLKAAAEQALTDVSNIDTTDTVGSGRFSREVVNQEATRFQTILEMQVASGMLDPTTTQTLLAAAGTTEGLMANYNVAVSTLGDQKTSELLQLATATGADGTTIDVLLQATAANPESFDGYVGALTSMRDIQAAGGITIDVNSGAGQAALEDAADTITALQAEKGEITLDVIQRVTGNNEMGLAIANNKDFQAMDKNQKISYIANYEAVMALQGNEAMQAGFEQYLLNHKGATFADYAAFLSGNAVTAGGGGGTAPANVLGTRPSGGGGGGTKEDAELAGYNKTLDKRQKALNVISIKEDAINKKFDQRKKALEEIQRINQSISEQQKDQLETSIALTSGDIASAARAVQAQRAKAAAYAQEEQMRALEKQRQDEIDNVSANGTNRAELEKQIDELKLKVAQREYELSGTQKSGGGGGGGGGSKPKKPADVAGYTWRWDDEIYGWVADKNAVGVPTTATAATTLTSAAPTAPSVAGMTADTAGKTLRDFNTRLAEWSAQNKTITDGVVSTLGLTSQQIGLFGTTSGLSIDGLKQKIIDMGGTVDTTGNVAIGGFRTTLENLAGGIKTAAEKAGVPWDGILSNLQKLKDKAQSASGPILTVAQQLWKATGAAGGTSRGPMPVATGGMISSRGVMYRAAGGGIPDFSAVGTDTIPAMLTPGEFVISRPAVKNFGVKNLQAINNGRSPEGSSSVYNYSVTVNAGSNASADDIARTVIGKIKQVESTRLKGNRF